jgi:hypothetical protein
VTIGDTRNKIFEAPKGPMGILKSDSVTQAKGAGLM